MNECSFLCQVLYGYYINILARFNQKQYDGAVNKDLLM